MLKKKNKVIGQEIVDQLINLIMFYIFVHNKHPSFLNDVLFLDTTKYHFDFKLFKDLKPVALVQLQDTYP